MRVVILGAGPAGITVAERLRALEPSIDLTMVTAEPYPPYSPPAMADHFLYGRDEPLYWKGEDVCERLGLDFRSNCRVGAIDAADRTVSLDDGATLDFDRLVIATGGRLYAPLAGLDLEGVYNFKSLAAAEALVAEVRHGEVERALIVGAGFIGVEVAVLLRGLGLEVSLIERLDRLMPGMLDEETGAIVADALRHRGIEVRLLTEAKQLVGNERVEGVLLANGDTLSADVYVTATGVQPNVDFLEGSGIDCGWGIRVDDRLRTSADGVFAAGDVAETHDRLSGERYVHAIFPNAVAQGEIVAANVLGHDLRYEGSEAMNSLKHLGLPVMAVGAVAGDETLRWQSGSILRHLVLREDRLIGFRLVGDVERGGVLRSLMLRRIPIGRFKERLLSGDFGFADLALTLPAVA